MSVGPARTGDVEWGNGWVLRAFVLVLALSLGGFVALGFWFEENMKVQAVGVVLALSAGIYNWYFRPRLIANADGVEIVNPLTRHRLAWAEVTSVTPGYSGLWFETEEGGHTCWAVQEGNLPARLTVNTRSQRVIAHLRDQGWIDEGP